MNDLSAELTPRQREIRDASDRYARKALSAVNGFEPKNQFDEPVAHVRSAMIEFAIWYAQMLLAEARAKAGE